VSSDGGAEDDEVCGFFWPVSGFLEFLECDSGCSDEAGCAEEVCADHFFPLVGVGGHDGAVESSACVDDDDVGDWGCEEGLIEELCGGGHHFVDGGLIGGVACYEGGSGGVVVCWVVFVEFLGEFDEILLAAGVEDELCAH